jgi:hypothetical protein
MGKKFIRLFIIKNRFEACAVIYALAVGSICRGMQFLEVYPGVSGWLLMCVCPIAVFMAGARLMEVTRKDDGHRRRKSDLDNGLRRRAADFAPATKAGTRA